MTFVSRLPFFTSYRLKNEVLPSQNATQLQILLYLCPILLLWSYAATIGLIVLDVCKFLGNTINETNELGLP